MTIKAEYRTKKVSNKFLLNIKQNKDYDIAVKSIRHPIGLPIELVCKRIERVIV